MLDACHYKTLIQIIKELVFQMGDQPSKEEMSDSFQDNGCSDQDMLGGTKCQQPSFSMVMASTSSGSSDLSSPRDNSENISEDDDANK